MLPEKQSFFDMQYTFQNVLSRTCHQVKSQNHLLLTPTNGAQKKCLFIQDQKVYQILKKVQEVLSEYLKGGLRSTEKSDQRLQERIDDNLKFSTKVQKLISLDKLLEAKADPKVLDPTLDQGETILPDKSTQSLLTYIQSTQNSIHGLEDIQTNPVINGDFLARILEMRNDELDLIIVKLGGDVTKIQLLCLVNSLIQEN